jgi:CAAX prenyl protease-like protein
METPCRSLLAHVLPIAIFLVLQALCDFLSGHDNFWLGNARYWIYPLQTLACACLLIWFRRSYDLRPPRQIGFALLIAAIVFFVWISPQQFLGFAPRRNGFNPGTLFRDHAFLYWSTVILRFLRLVLIVPFLEEIFWRAFLLRFVIREDFEAIAFGTFNWASFLVVAIAFGLSHSIPDRPAALAAGALYNVVAYRTRSLTCCVVAHATTNLLLGLWIMQTHQWGFW